MRQTYVVVQEHGASCVLLVPANSPDFVPYHDQHLVEPAEGADAADGKDCQYCNSL